MFSPSLRCSQFAVAYSQLGVAWGPVASHTWVDAPKGRRVRVRSGMGVVAVVRRAGLRNPAVWCTPTHGAFLENLA